MSNIVLVLAAIIIFVAAVISPHVGNRIQRKTDSEANWLKRMSNWLWDPLTWWAKKSIEFTRRIIVKIAAWGKKTRRDFDKKNDK